MTDERFIEKYGLLRFWETLEEYKKEKKSTNILGGILVYILNHFGYLTKYEPLEEIDIDDVENFWNESSVRFVEFKINSENRFCAFIPYKNYVKSILDIEIEDVF